MALIGTELYYNPSLSTLERYYCRIFGVPIVGLRIRLRRIIPLLPKTATKVLDAGCGRGIISRYLARRYTTAQIDAIDLNSEAQQQNREISMHIGIGNCNFINADLSAPLPHNNYDLIVSIDNLEHIEDDSALLTHFYQALATDGTLLIHVPHYYRRWPIFKWQENFDVPGHFRPGYHLPQLTELLQKAGFRIKKSGYSYGFLENFSNNLSYFITRAEERNRIIYALFFPILNLIAWFGQRNQPQCGAGVWVIAKKSISKGHE